MRKLLLFMGIILCPLLSIAQDYSNVVLSELSGDAGQSDGANDGIVEISGPPGTNIGCMVVSNAEWAVVIPDGMTIPADSSFLIACGTDSTSNFGVGIIGAYNGIACDECDFPYLEIDLDVCLSANEVFYDPAATGFTLDNSHTNDGDNVVLFQPDGTVHDAVFWGEAGTSAQTGNPTLGGASGNSDNTILSGANGSPAAAYTLGTPGVLGTGSPAAAVATMPEGGICAADLITYTMPPLSDPVWVNIGENQKGCNSSYIRIANNTPGHFASAGNGIAINQLTPSSIDASLAAAQWGTTDHPNPGKYNDKLAWKISTTNMVLCTPGTVTFTLEIYNWQHVSDNSDTYSAVENLQIGSYVLPPSSDPNQALNAAGIQVWDTYNRDNNTGITTLTYTTGVLPPGNHEFKLQWDDYSNELGSTASINSSNECYERETIIIEVAEPMIVTKSSISCPTDFEKGTINLSKLVTGGFNTQYELFLDNPTMSGIADETNASGSFVLPTGIASTDIRIRIVSQAPCEDTAVVTVDLACISDPDCPSIKASEFVGGGNNLALCPNDSFCIKLTDFDKLGAIGAIDFYYDGNTGFDPYNGEGTFAGSINIEKSTNPGGPFPVAIVINEILYNPAGSDGSGAATTCEAVELYATPGTDLGCYSITDGDWVIQIPENTIVDNDGIFLIASSGCTSGEIDDETIDLDLSICGCGTGSADLNLTNSGEFVALTDATGTIIDGITFDDPTAANSPTGTQTAPGIGTCNNYSINASAFIYPTGDDPDAGNGLSIQRIPDGSGGFSDGMTPTMGALNSLTPPSDTIILDSFCFAFDESFCNFNGTGDIFLVGIINPHPNTPLTCPNAADSAKTIEFTVNISCPEAVLLADTIAQCQAEGDVDFNVNLSGGSGTYDVFYSEDGVSKSLLGVSHPATITITAPTNGEIEITLDSVFDAGGQNCSGPVSGGTALVQIYPDAAITHRIIADSNYCAEPIKGTVTFAFEGTGPWEFEYSDGTDIFEGFTSQDTFVLEVLNEGTYTLISVTDELGCGTPTLSGSALIECPATISSLGNFVWLDRNGDGIQDINEPGVQGVTVILTGIDSMGNAVMETTITDSLGAYLFDSLQAGNYVVEFVPPSGFNFSPSGTGLASNDSDADLGTGMTDSIALPAGVNNLDVDAGIYQTATIGDYVWFDADEDGIQDFHEQGIVGAKVVLCGVDGAGNIIKDSVYTNGGGYIFTGLAPGTYTIQIFPPDSSYIPTVQNVGHTGFDSDIDANGMTGPIVVNAGDNIRNIDAGFYLPFVPLPINLVHFGAFEEACANNITFSFEGMEYRFEVILERSTDGFNFLEAGSKVIDYGDRSIYNLIDHDINNVSYYRLKWVENNVSFYSDIISVKNDCLEIEPDVKIFPNPARDFIQISFTLKQEEMLSILLFDKNGRIVHTLEKQFIVGSNLEQIDLSTIANGNYFLRVSNQNGMLFNSKIIVLK